MPNASFSPSIRLHVILPLFYKLRHCFYGSAGGKQNPALGNRDASADAAGKPYMGKKVV